MTTGHTLASPLVSGGHKARQAPGECEGSGPGMSNCWHHRDWDDAVWLIDLQIGGASFENLQNNRNI